MRRIYKQRTGLGQVFNICKTASFQILAKATANDIYLPKSTIYGNSRSFGRIRVLCPDWLDKPLHWQPFPFLVHYRPPTSPLPPVVPTHCSLLRATLTDRHLRSDPSFHQNVWKALMDDPRTCPSVSCLVCYQKLL